MASMTWTKRMQSLTCRRRARARAIVESTEINQSKSAFASARARAAPRILSITMILLRHHLGNQTIQERERIVRLVVVAEVAVGPDDLGAAEVVEQGAALAVVAAVRVVGGVDE